MLLNALIKAFQTTLLVFFSPEYKEDPGDQIKCLSTTLLEELGNVKYIFSDKTGTLTQNEMIFKAFSIYTKLFDVKGSNQHKVIDNKIKPKAKIKNSFI